MGGPNNISTIWLHLAFIGRDIWLENFDQKNPFGKLNQSSELFTQFSKLNPIKRVAQLYNTRY